MGNKLRLRLLKGNCIQLEPLNESHRAGLAKAADYEAIWQYMPHKAYGSYFTAWFDNSLAQIALNKELIYVVRSSTEQRLLGATAYYDLHLEHLRLSLGYTWYVPDAWGSGINSECKLLMLGQAFDDWGMSRVEIGADPCNTRSVKAIEKLGAIKEGTLRQHMKSHHGLLTDTVVYSILAREWPELKRRLSQSSPIIV